MKKITFTHDEFHEVLSVLDVDMSCLTARDILALEELTPLKRDTILTIAEEQISIRNKTLTNILRAEYEEALRAEREEAREIMQ